MLKWINIPYFIRSHSATSAFERAGVGWANTGKQRHRRRRRRRRTRKEILGFIDDRLVTSDE
jgi:hypothetical protein